MRRDPPGDRGWEVIDRAAVAYHEGLRAGNPDRSARAALIALSLPGAMRLARHCVTPGSAPGDVESAAQRALVDTLDRYEPSQGSFTACAVAGVRAEMGQGHRSVSGSARPAVGAPAAPERTVPLAVPAAVARLPARERRIVSMRLVDGYSTHRIAVATDLTHRQIVHLFSRAFDWMRAAMLTDAVPPWPERDSAAALDLVVVRHAATVTLRVYGEVDDDTAGELRDALVGAVSRSGSSLVEVCLDGVALIDVAGLRALEEGADLAMFRGITFRLTGVQPYVRRVLAISRIRAFHDP